MLGLSGRILACRLVFTEFCIDITAGYGVETCSNGTINGEIIVGCFGLDEMNMSVGDAY